MFPEGRLRILATTDLHMHLLGGDDTPETAEGRDFAALADVITERRKSSDVTTLLFDNGDFLQGTPLADAEADRLGTGSPHLMAQAFNLLEYDAITLGNHEFDYGIERLAAFLGQVNCPVVSANIQPPDHLQAWAPFTILERSITCHDGQSHAIRIGVTGFAPQSLVTARELHTTGFSVAAANVLPAMKRAGADIVVALCHAGLASPDTPTDETANSLAEQAAIDCMILGHTHEVFPDRAAAPQEHLDHRDGTIAGKPAVMAAYHGRALGEIDLILVHRPDGWTIQDHSIRIHTPAPSTRSRSAARTSIEDIAAPAYQRMRAQMSEPIGQSGTRLHNHLATVFPDPVATLCAKVMRQAVTAAIGGPCPIAAVAPFQPAGRKGRHILIDLPAGTITRRDVAGLAPFQDRLCAIRRSGRQIREWLERSAAHYADLAPDASPKPLINPDSAGYFCDGLFGLRYEIDLGQPAAFDLTGAPVPGQQGRIGDIRLAGRLLEDDARVALATTSFRAGGGGGYPIIPDDDILWTSDKTLQVILSEAISAGAAQNLPFEEVWTFRAPQGAAAIVYPAPGGPALQGTAAFDISPYSTEPPAYLLQF